MKFYFPDGDGGKKNILPPNSYLTVVAEITCKQNDLSLQLPNNPTDGDLVLWTDSDTDLMNYLAYIAEYSQWYLVNSAMTLSPINSAIDTTEGYLMTAEEKEILANLSDTTTSELDLDYVFTDGADAPFTTEQINFIFN